ncbi:hypothetical protein CXB51_031871 [Gossypium anomalum]|uniref:Uncharacterized protein n=1 Tax=Gossypium anomalum TaxID=47600 RepID=A0A8J6CLB9_9ROSI|nr:hypothetical protein CXB51_031871 [Gossypium anomalum]
MADHGFLGGPPRPRTTVVVEWNETSWCISKRSEDGVFMAHRNEREKGKTPFWFLAPFHGHWPNPQGFSGLQIGVRRLSQVCGMAMTEAWWPRRDQQFGSSMLGARAAAVFSSLQRARVQFVWAVLGHKTLGHIFVGDEICHGNLIRPTATSEHLQGDKVHYGDFIQLTATSEGDKTNGFILLYCNFREIRFATVDLIRPTATSEGDKVCDFTLLHYNFREIRFAMVS